MEKSIYQDFLKIIPPAAITNAEFHDQTPWNMNDSGCGVIINTFRPQPSITVAEKLKPGALGPDAHVRNRIWFEFPGSLKHPVIMKGKPLHQTAKSWINSEGQVQIQIDLYREYLDTGGYFIRTSGEILLDNNGKLIAVSARDYEANKWFWFFGPMSDFKLRKKIQCLKAP